MASYTPKPDFQVAIEKCELCKEEEANFFCTDCHENMCVGCKTAHISSRASRNHNVVSSSLGKSDIKPRKPIKCTTHPRENIQMYCTTCDEAACHKCIADIKHKKHNFEELETALNKYKGDLSKHVSDIRQHISDIQKLLHNVDVNEKEYIKESDKTIDGINKQRQQIKSNVDNIADYMVDQVQKQRKPDIQLFEKERENIQKILTQQSQHLESCEETLKFTDNVSDIKRKIKQSKKFNLPFITHINPPTFEGDETMDLQHIFGKLVGFRKDLSSNQKASGDEVQTYKTKSDDRAESSSVNTISTDVVSKFKSYKMRCFVSTVNDKEAWCGGNKDVVLVDIHSHVKKRIKLDNNLCSIAVISAEELLVTEYDSTNIKKYLSDKKYVNITNTEPYIAGIACDNIGCILISDCINDRIHQIDIDGGFIQFILTGQHGIQWPRGLSIDNKGQLWLCNQDGHEVVVYKYRS